MRKKTRSISLSTRSENRFWWHRHITNYVPPIYEFLEDKEWNLLEDWYAETERNKTVGECGVPLMNFLLGMITGNRIDSIVELGHYMGYSTFLIGCMMRKMDVKDGFVSVDIDPEAHTYTAGVIKKAGLDEYVSLEHSSSVDPLLIGRLEKKFPDGPKLVIIDSSHQYAHTLEELDRWYSLLRPGGFLVLHDVSKFAGSFDSTAQGGVHRALAEWGVTKGSAQWMMINEEAGPIEDLVYKDGCGIGLVQKPLHE